MLDQLTVHFDKIQIRKNDQVYVTPEACKFEPKLRKNVDRLGFEPKFLGFA